MAKVKPHTVKPKEKYQAINSLFEVVSSLKTKQEIINFFLGLFTPSEALMVARRIQIAQMLLEDKSYEEIRKKLKVGTATVQRTYQWLHGGDDKYNNWLQNKIQKIGKSDKSNQINNTIEYDSLLDKYPYHRFIKNIFGK